MLFLDSSKLTIGLFELQERGMYFIPHFLREFITFLLKVGSSSIVFLLKTKTWLL